jgi:hypothetical protein
MIEVPTLAEAYRIPNVIGMVAPSQTHGALVYVVGDEAAWAALLPPPSLLIPAVTPWQIRKALNALGLRAAVEAAVKASDQNTQDAWQYATEFRRDNPLVTNIGLALGKTSEEVDALFELALNDGVPTDNPLTTANEATLSFWQTHFPTFTAMFATLFK